MGCRTSRRSFGSGTAYRSCAFSVWGLADRVPDYSTIWRFREALVAAGGIEELFARFDRTLTERGYFALGGQLIDASIVEAPRQRLTVEEKRQIRSGERPDWPMAKARHKDIEAALGGLLTAVPSGIGSSVC
jgi:IS5 family transposase